MKKTISYVFIFSYKTTYKYKTIKIQIWNKWEREAIDFLYYSHNHVYGLEWKVLIANILAVYELDFR